MKQQFHKKWLLTGFLLTGTLFGSTLALAQAPQPGFPLYYSDSPEGYLQRASQSASAQERELYLLEGAGSALQSGNLQQAKDILAGVDTTQLPPSALTEKTLLEANLALKEGDAIRANDFLESIPQPSALGKPMQIAYYQLASAAAYTSGQVLRSAEFLVSLDPLLQDPNAQRQNRQDTLNQLESLPLNILNQQRTRVSDTTLGGWIDIAYLDKQFDGNPKAFQQQLSLWQQQYPNHPAVVLFTEHKSGWWFVPHIGSSSGPRTTTVAADDSSHIALLLPTTGSLAAASAAIQEGFMANYYMMGGNHSIKVYDTQGRDVPTVYKQAIADGATLVVGPLTKEEVASLQRFRHLPVPTVALNSVTPFRPMNNLYQFSLSPEDESSQAAHKALSDGHSRALIIAPDNAWGQGVVQAFQSTFENQGGQSVSQVSYRKGSRLNDEIKDSLAITASMDRTTAVQKALGRTSIETLPRRRQDLDMVFIVANPDTAREIKPLLSFYFAKDLPVYGTSLVYTGTPDPMKDQDLNGIRFCTLPWLIDNNTKISSVKSVMKANGTTVPAGQAQSLYAFGYDAYEIALNLDHLPDNMKGMTGTLYVDNDNQIHRQLPWATFKDGVPSKVS